MFKALVVNDSQSQSIEAKLEEVNITQLPEGDVLVKIDYSTLNYKDALAITNSSPIIKKFPMVPGIDFSFLENTKEVSDIIKKNLSNI